MTLPAGLVEKITPKKIVGAVCYLDSLAIYTACTMVHGIAHLPCTKLASSLPFRFWNHPFVCVAGKEVMTRPQYVPSPTPYVDNALFF